MAEDSKLTSVSKKVSKKDIEQSLLLEVAWEAVNQVGGIYTVIRSKSPFTVDLWNELLSDISNQMN